MRLQLILPQVRPSEFHKHLVCPHSDCQGKHFEHHQEADKVPGLKRNHVFAGLRTPALGGDLTSVKCSGEWLPLGLAVDDTAGLVLTVDELGAEDAETLKEWLEPVAKAVDAQLLVSDDADAFKTVANELGLEHQERKPLLPNAQDSSECIYSP